MRAPSFLSILRRRSLWPVLMLAYALLAQSILGNAAASAHAFAMAQHDAMGLGMLCLEDGRMVVADPGKTAPRDQAPEADCLACKIACAAAVGMPALPQPDAVAQFIVYPSRSVAFASPADTILAQTARFPSDLASRAPPAALI